MASFGEGLGAVIGSSMAADKLSGGLDSVNGAAANFGSVVEPYNTFGQSFLGPATSAINNVQNTAGTQSYDDFMKNYQTSDAAKYAIGQGTEAVNNSSAAQGKLLSGSNERALSTMQQGISSQFANQAYGSYLQGNQQNFGQLETALGNMSARSALARKPPASTQASPIARWPNSPHLRKPRRRTIRPRAPAWGPCSADWARLRRCSNVLSRTVCNLAVHR